MPPPLLLPAGVPVPALFPHQPPAELPGKHCRRRKARTVFSDSQLSGLEKRFEIQRYLSTPERVELATALSLSETQVGGGRLRPLSPTPRSVPDGDGRSPRLSAAAPQDLSQVQPPRPRVRLARGRGPEEPPPAVLTAALRGAATPRSRSSSPGPLRGPAGALSPENRPGGAVSV